MYNFIVVFLSILLYMSDTAFPSQRVPTDCYYLCCHSTTGPVSRLLITVDILITFLHTVIRISTRKCDLENTATYNVLLERAES